MPKFKKTSDQLAQELKEQIQALRASCASYDDGNIWEAKRLATTIHILIHDSEGGRSRSLLGQLSLKSKLELYSSVSDPMTSCEYIGWNSARSLVVARVEYPGASYVPKMDGRGEVYRPMIFQAWYEETIFRSFDGASVSRKNLIHYVRSQDGGAHVDAHLSSETYAYWKANGDPSLRFVVEENPPSVSVCGPIIEIATGKHIHVNISEEGEFPVRYATQASVRQISWEVDSALVRLGF